MEFKKTFISAVVLALFLGTDVQGVKLGRHGNFSAGKEPDEPMENSFLQTGFIDNEKESETTGEMIDTVIEEMETSKRLSQQMKEAERDSGLLQLSVQNAKNEISKEAGRALAQTESRHKTKAVKDLSDEIEKVFNFERDVASAKVQDPNFDNKVQKIDNYMMSYRKTYKDPDYLRDPLPPFASAARRMNDKAARHFEATKLALDDHKTAYKIKQSEAAANL